MKKVIASPDAPKAVGPYSQAIEAGGTLYISGQLPINPAARLKVASSAATSIIFLLEGTSTVALISISPFT